MRIALVTSIFPFIKGGARNIVDWLAEELIQRGHSVEIITIPQYDSPENILQQSYGMRLLKFGDVEKVITFRPQSHLVQHPNKTVWFIHHIRVFYDLWDSAYRDFPDDEIHRGIRRELVYLDSHGLLEATNVYSNSITVSNRLKKFNNIESEVLYPPLSKPERFRFVSENSQIVYISRIEHHKRQHVIIEAMRWIPQSISLRIVGKASSPEYLAYLENLISIHNLSSRVKLEDRWISEEEKIDLLGRCWMNVYIPLDEDSYGYSTLEAAYSQKATITLRDSGGVSEFVVDGINGIIASSDPIDLGIRITEVYTSGRSRVLGIAARRRIDELNINWDYVIESLLK